MFRRMFSTAIKRTLKYKNPPKIPKMSDGGIIWAEYGMYIKQLTSEKEREKAVNLLILANKVV